MLRTCKRIATKLASHNTFRSLTTSAENLPSRAFLYVPASDTRKLAKARDLKVDCLVLNCEDGVAFNQKDVARRNVAEILGNSDAKFAADVVSVRVNDLSTPFFADDLKAILTTASKPRMIVLPKVNSAEDMTQIAKHFEQHKTDHIADVIICIESAQAVMCLREICETARRLSSSAHFTPAGLLFGGDDYLASVGAAKTDDHAEITYARQKTVNVARAFGLQAIDIVHINYKNLAQLEAQCLQGARMGYTGKQVIHPMQIETVHRCFKPSDAQIEWATSLLKEFEAHEKKGTGAFTFRGNMIDAPLMKQARNIVNMSKK